MEDYLKLAQDIARDASQIALKYFGFDVAITWKSDNSPLTQADTEINRMVIERIVAAYPEHSIKGEEESLLKEGSRYIWVCDPVDGTVPFLNGLSMFMFSLALVDQTDGQPVMGLVNDPVGKNMYWAYSGSGAFRNGKKISVNKNPVLERTHLTVEGPTNQVADAMKSLRKKGGRTMKLSGFIYGGIQVPNGRLSGSIIFNARAHDIATLKIITEEAGGKATDLQGESRRYDKDGFGFIISNGLVHDEILDAINNV